ncbi:hypothetical protein C8C83_1727 [Flavobacterium sp. 90]|uniref:hypothetical protein n=1 Tax=unclassified Flavobacterium TaxID=196869 RepID=UPI000EB09247|nr:MULTISPECIES: hypothetical protein [unclassified Flavobacterium]RKR10059.1 hypothetical protein C8C82_2029 [Flavobacterium sp. 81]TCK53844.1 hypothetical protein C8C83_1727 [Flavobacterium sp. 90]
MKTIILKIFAVLYFILQPNIYSQQLVQTINDVYRLKNNEEQFINKPLKDLLKELKPEIKTVFVMSDNNFFYFKFLPLAQLKKNEGTLEDRVSLFVYIKGGFEWNWGKRPKGSETIWTKEDLQKYGNLIVRKIGVVPAGNE